MKSCTDLRCAQRLHRTNLLGQPRAGGAAGVVSRSSYLYFLYPLYKRLETCLLVDTQTNNLVETTQRIPDVSPALRINGRPHHALRRTPTRNVIRGRAGRYNIT